MSKVVRAAAIAVVAAMAGCSGGGGGGGGQAASPTTTSTAPTTTSVAPTSTTPSQEDQVKAAYLAYWQMVDRLSAAPNPDDAELATRATDPLLSFLRDDFSTRAEQGRTTHYPDDPTLNSHHIRRVELDTKTARIVDCFVDGRIAVLADGTTDADVVTKQATATMLLEGQQWLISNVHFDSEQPGASACSSAG
jgi:hypothetical protein